MSPIFIVGLSLSAAGAAGAGAAAAGTAGAAARGGCGAAQHLLAGLHEVEDLEGLRLQEFQFPLEFGQRVGFVHRLFLLLCSWSAGPVAPVGPATTDAYEHADGVLHSPGSGIAPSANAHFSPLVTKTPARPAVTTVNSRSARQGTTSASGPSPRTRSASIPSFMWRRGLASDNVSIQEGAKSRGQKLPDRQPSGSTTRLQAAEHACSVPHTAPMRMPKEKKESTPRRKSGTAIHQLLSSRSPKNGRNATAMNRAAWTTATTTVTENRDIRMVCGFTGANRRRRSRPFCRQLTRF